MTENTPLTFGVEMEFYVAWRREGRPPPGAPFGYESRPGKPVVIHSDKEDPIDDIIDVMKRQIVEFIEGPSRPILTRPPKEPETKPDEEPKRTILDKLPRPAGDLIRGLALKIRGSSHKEEKVPDKVPDEPKDDDKSEVFREILLKREEEAWKALEDYREWNVDEDGSLKALPDALASYASSGYGWCGVEVISPPLMATHEGFDEVRRVCEFIQNTYLTYDAPQAGLHIHVGQGVKWPAGSSFRRVAGLLYAADPVLAQLHPPRRWNSHYCQSNRLYSLLSFRDRTGPKESLYELTNLYTPSGSSNDQSRESPSSKSISTGSRESTPSESSSTESSEVPSSESSSVKIRNSARDDCFPPRPNKICYSLDHSKVIVSRSSHLKFHVEALTYQPKPMVEALIDLLERKATATIARLMQVHPERAAYNFDSFIDGGTKRTVEFRQPAGTTDPVQVICQAKIAVRLYQFGLDSSDEELIKILLDCHDAEADPRYYDVYDLLVDLGLKPEARVIQAALAGTVDDTIRNQYWSSRGYTT
ncbi:hypothetical protein F5Y04DRAFT_291530 [Hypomontagnella monticulosa]|nr:hypothetical protein F5Y04DRAFT_291530 [Hypomontagnella monticulosa]